MLLNESSGVICMCTFPSLHACRYLPLLQYKHILKYLTTSNSNQNYLFVCFQVLLFHVIAELSKNLPLYYSCLTLHWFSVLYHPTKCSHCFPSLSFILLCADYAKYDIICTRRALWNSIQCTFVSGICYLFFQCSYDNMFKLGFQKLIIILCALEPFSFFLSFYLLLFLYLFT